MSAAQRQDPERRPARVVSLLPSATEMLALIGAEIVGRSHECDFPDDVRERVPSLTGAYNKFETSAQMHEAVTESMRSGRGLYWLDAHYLAELRPDAIVTQSLCAVCAVDLDVVRQAAAKIFPPPRIIDTNPMSLQDVISDVRRLGTELGLAQNGDAAAAALQVRVDRAVALAAELSAAAAVTSGTTTPAPKRVVFLEWTMPLFPGGHWTPQIIHMAGGVCPVNPPRPEAGGGALPSREIDPSELVAADPDLVIVAPCGLDLETTRREVSLLQDFPWWRGLRAVQSGNVVLVDGNQYFNRPGPRLVDALEWLVALLSPIDVHRNEHMPACFPWEWLPPRPLPLAPPAAEPLEGRVFAAATTAGESSKAAIGAATTPPRATTTTTTAAEAPAAAAAATAAASSEPGSGPVASSADGHSCQERLRPLGNGIRSGWEATAADAAAAAASPVGAVPAALVLSPSGNPRHAGMRATATAAAATANGTTSLAAGVAAKARHSNGQLVPSKDGARGFSCNGEGGAAAATAAGKASGDIDPWVATCSPWSSAPHLPRDIEDLHAAACEQGKSSYDDPETGFMVFTHAGLAKRQGGHCCANRCRHCPWGHARVAGGVRPRLNRVTRPALLHPTAAAQRAWKQRQSQRLQQQQQQQPCPQPQSSVYPVAKKQKHPSEAPPAIGGDSGARSGGGIVRAHLSAVVGGGDDAKASSPVAVAEAVAAGGGGGGGAGLTLVCHEGGEASEVAVRRTLAEAAQGAPGTEGHRVVLLAAFDVDTGALWGRGGAAMAVMQTDGAAIDGAAAASSHFQRRDDKAVAATSGSGGGCGPSSARTRQIDFSAVHISPVMDASLQYNLDLIAVPLQVRGTTWPYDQAAIRRVLSYVVRTAAELLGEAAVTRVVAVRLEDGTPDLFVSGTAGAVPGGWPEIVRRVNAELCSVSWALGGAYSFGETSDYATCEVGCSR